MSDIGHRVWSWAGIASLATMAVGMTGMVITEDVETWGRVTAFGFIGCLVLSVVAMVSMSREDRR